MKEPREIHIHEGDLSAFFKLVDGMITVSGKVYATKSEHTGHNFTLMREVLPGITDTDRLECLLKGRVVLSAGEKFFIGSPIGKGKLYDSPREAIDGTLRGDG